MSSSNYRQIAFDNHGRECEECGQTENLQVHHRDRDRENNDPENLAVLCETCHWDRHRDEVAERSSGPQKKIAATPNEEKTAREELLELLREGRITAPYAESETGYSIQYIRKVLTRLRDHGHIRRVHTGLYELVDDPLGAGDA